MERETEKDRERLRRTERVTEKDRVSESGTEREWKKEIDKMKYQLLFDFYSTF